MAEIILDLKKDPELLNTTAKEWAEKINKTKKTQVRNFYDKILELDEKIKKEEKHKSKEEAFKEVYPFIKMLNSKVAYGVSRKVVSLEFQQMMEECLAQITYNLNGKEKFETFKLFFEAVLGFFKGRE